MVTENLGGGMTAAQVAAYRRHKTDPHFPDVDDYAREWDYETDIANALDDIFGSSRDRLRRIVLVGLVLAALLIAAAFAAPFLQQYVQ